MNIRPSAANPPELQRDCRYVPKNGRANIPYIERRRRFGCYEDNYFSDENSVAVSLTMPISQKEYKSPVLFPFF